ncbi:hypothetical protein CROQUDRAFT_658642 [Cronartium quercuum f. sp. fusiforme G11]|uniref:Uncharacterized protein n=1 Tax=Cronartium quercuum f. sp. fusiforme G11 TaxID=708437 RepID=A0A9P6NJU3_9BASI|nr:hypothetical protein CROQUDRAFT_658642 [Cronartium quercuum f. sp. fusiforme G11]
MNSSVRQPPSPGTLFNSFRHSTNLKRKRNQSELSNNSAKSSTNPSWFGLAFQLPSVIKREFTDFVKTVRGGYSQAMEGNFVDQIDHHPLDPPQHLPSTFPRRTRDHHSKKTTKTKKALNQQSQPKSHATLPAHHRQYQPMQLGSDDLNEETDTDQPSPPKKLRLSNSTNLTQLKSALSPRSPILSISSGPGSPRPFLLKSQYCELA